MTPVNHDVRIIDEDSLSPSPWHREPGFPSLVYTILEQQVSLASARAVYERLLGIIGEVTPAQFTTIDDQTLRTIGFSRQKTAYCRDVAMRLQSGQLNLETLADAADETVRHVLTEIRGIGPWTADATCERLPRGRRRRSFP